MKYLSRALPIIALLCLGGLVGTLLYFSARVDFNTDIPQETDCPPSTGFRLARYLSGIDSSKIMEQFPFNAYLDSANICDIKSIAQDINLLDSALIGNFRRNREVIGTALTVKLQERIEKRNEIYAPDSLIRLFQWAIRFKYYAETDAENSKLFRVVYRHWLGYISNKLEGYYIINPKVKYDFKFKYLAGLCHSNKFSPPISNSKLEKIINYTIEKRFTYLFNRFWNSTSLTFKTIAILTSCLILYSFWCLIKVHFKL